MKAFLSVLVLGLAAACSDPHPALKPDAAPADSNVDALNACLNAQGTPANCFQQDVCAPAGDLDFLNGCTDVSGVAFDNVARLPRYNNGTLPALP